jgi:hypothetical protein
MIDTTWRRTQRSLPIDRKPSNVDFSQTIKPTSPVKPLNTEADALSTPTLSKLNTPHKINPISISSSYLARRAAQRSTLLTTPTMPKRVSKVVDTKGYNNSMFL